MPMAQAGANDPTPIREWGIDHWMLFAYLGTICAEEDFYCGYFDCEKLRINPARHEEFCGKKKIPWSPDNGTRLADYAKDATYAKINWHDDIDCLKDMEAAGVVEILDIHDRQIMFTSHGVKILEKLNKYKLQTRNVSNFRYESE